MVSGKKVNRVDVVHAPEPPGTGASVEDTPGNGDAGPVEVNVVEHECTREQGHASSSRVAGPPDHRMFHARRRQSLQNLVVFASVDDLSWLGQVRGTLKFMHSQMGDQA